MDSKTKVRRQHTQSQYLTPFQRKLLRRALRTERHSAYLHRIKIMLLADIGKTQAQICRQLGCSQETVRYWTAIAQSGNAHLWKECPLGRPKTVDDRCLDYLKEMIERGPNAYGYAFRRWTGHWLSKHLQKEFDIEVSPRHVNRLLKQMGLSTRRPPTPASQRQSGNASFHLKIDDLPSSAAVDQQWFLPTSGG